MFAFLRGGAFIRPSNKAPVCSSIVRDQNVAIQISLDINVVCCVGRVEIQIEI